MCGRVEWHCGRMVCIVALQARGRVEWSCGSCAHRFQARLVGWSGGVCGRVEWRWSEPGITFLGGGNPSKPDLPSFSTIKM